MDTFGDMVECGDGEEEEDVPKVDGDKARPVLNQQPKVTRVERVVVREGRADMACREGGQGRGGVDDGQG